jgi:hypothetical protein
MKSDSYGELVVDEQRLHLQHPQFWHRNHCLSLLILPNPWTSQLPFRNSIASVCFIMFIFFQTPRLMHSASIVYLFYNIWFYVDSCVLFYRSSLLNLWVERLKVLIIYAHLFHSTDTLRIINSLYLAAYSF